MAGKILQIGKEHGEESWLDAEGQRDAGLDQLPDHIEQFGLSTGSLEMAASALDLGQVFFRPARRAVPFRTPIRGVYLCSAATPPGGGVHGLCGLAAARAALWDVG